MNSATLSGSRVTSATVSIPAWGCWWALVSIDGEKDLTGAVDLTIADLTLKGTIVSGGKQQGRSSFHVVGGAGGWGKTIPAKDYSDDAAVKLSTVLKDAAESVKEKIDLSTIANTNRLGPDFVRPEQPASYTLESVAERGWYVGEDGITHIGRRPAAALTTSATRVTPVDKQRGTLELAAESIAKILPGAIIDGLEALDVEHSISAKGGVRTMIWGKLGASSFSRRLDAMRQIFEQLDPYRRYRGFTEYRVVTQEGERLNLQPIRVSTGMPELRRVYVRPGVSGCRATVKLGSRVLVAFADADPARPFVASFEDAEGEGFLPLVLKIDATEVLIGNGVKPVAAAGDLAGGIWPIAPTQTKVLV